MTTADTCLPCQSRGRARPAAPGYSTCNSCSDDIRDDLAEIRDRYPRLDSAFREPAPDVSNIGRVWRSKSPANDHILGMTDPRSTTTGRAYSPPATLGGWVQALMEDTGIEVEGSSVGAMVRYLLKLHAHITAQPWVDDYARELHELVEALRLVTPDPRTGELGSRRREVGTCKEVLDDGEACGTKLFAPTHGDTIRCGGCRKEWPRPTWLELGKVAS